MFDRAHPARDLFLAFLIVCAPLHSLIGVASGTPSLTMIDRVAMLYKEGKAKEARQTAKSWITNAHRMGLGEQVAGVRRTTESRGRIVLNMQRLVERVYELETRTPKPNWAPLEEIMSAASRAAEDISSKMAKTSKKDEGYLVDQAKHRLGQIVRGEIKVLEQAGKAQKASRLKDQYTAVLKMKNPEDEPDSVAFIKSSGASPGPFQKAEACYGKRLPEKARVRVIDLLASMRDSLRASLASGQFNVDAALVPKQMVDYVFAAMAWERSLTAEFTRDQHFPPSALPTLKKCVELVKDALSLLPGDRKDPKYMAALKKSSEWAGRLTAFLARARHEVSTRGKPSPETAPASGPIAQSFDWRRANTITGDDFSGACLINEFYAAMANEDALALDKILAKGPDYASGKEIIQYVQHQKEAGVFDKLLGYKVIPATQFRFARVQGGTKVLVHSLQARLVVQGKEVIRTNSGIFDLVRTSAGIRLGYPKRKVHRKPGRVSPESRPATTQSATTTMPRTVPQDNRRIRK